MRAGAWLLGALLVGCNGSGSDTDTDGGNGGADGCAVPGAALPDLFDELDGIDHFCEDQPLYDPDVSTATSYFIGEFDIDECGNVTGTETWVLFANPKWIENGGYDCQIVWTVTGTQGDPVTKGAYSLTLSANVDLDRTDCPTDAQNTPIYAGDTSMALVYDVEVVGGDSIVYFESGNQLGAGFANAGHVSYLSDVDCLLF